MRRAVGVLLVCRVRLLVCFVVAAATTAGAMIVPTESRAALLAPTPYMGWNTYYGVGGRFDEATVKSVASALIRSGLAQAGYRMVWLDFGWATGARDNTGQLIVNATQWPDGMAALATWLHQQGLQAGIYTDAGRTGCNGQGVGSYGHYQQDADTFAAWGFDAVKVDFCGAGQEGFAPQPLYTQFAAALSNNSSHSAMMLNVDNFWVPGQIDGTNPGPANSSYGNYQWSPPIAQSWRTDTDIGFTRNVVFSNVLRNLDNDAAHPEAAGPGHWNDPDYLGPELGMSATEAQSQLSMWAILAAPLILGSDPRVLSAASIGMLENANVIAVDQDPLGAQGTLVQQIGQAQVWAKPLADGETAVALLNRGTSALQINTTASAVGLPQASGYNIKDLWTSRSTATGADGTVAALVPAHAVALERVSATGGGGDSPGTVTLTVGAIGSHNGSVTANTNTISCPGTCTARYPIGTVVTLTATPAPGASFAGWRGGGCSGTGTCTTTVSADTKVTAAFVSSVHSLSVSLAGSGSVIDAYGAISCPGACSTGYSDGTQISLTARPNPGWAFAGWSGGGCSGTGACAVTLKGDAAVTASFVPAHTLTMAALGAGNGTITGPGISCPGVCSASYPVGTSVTLIASPARGSRFGAWFGGACPAAKRRCTVTLSRDITLGVAFDLPRTGTAYVVNTRRDTVIPVDLATNRTERAIRGFDRPSAIAIAPDGGIAYVVNAGNAALTPIDLATNRTEPAITGFAHPGPIAVARNGKRAYVLEDGGRLVAVDLLTNQSEPPIAFAKGSGVGRYASSIAIAPNGKTAYLGTFTRVRRAVRGTVAAVDLATGNVRALIRGFADPSAIAITPDGKVAYVADAARGDVTPINLSANRRMAAPALTARGAFPGAAAMAITPNGKTVYVATSHRLRGARAPGYGVGVIDTATNTNVFADLTRIASPSGVAITPNGGTAYVAGKRSVIPFDVASSTERPPLAGFGSPAAIATTVPPPWNDSARLSRQPQATGSEVSDAVTCSASKSACTTIQTLTVTVSRPTAGVLAAQAQRQRSRPVILIIGTRTVTIRPHRTLQVTISLNPAGRRLLQRFGSLPVVLSLAIRRSAHADTVDTRRLTIKTSSRP